MTLSAPDAGHVARRSLLLGAAGAAVALQALAQPATSRSFTDAAGRRVAVPLAPRRVFPAGPGAAVLILAVAPQSLLGWPMRLGDAATSLLPRDITERPALGRLTGARPTADADRVRNSGADLVLDMGTVNATYAALADRVQSGSNLPTVLLDGAPDRTPALLRETGLLLGAEARAEALATAAERTLSSVAAARQGWRPPRLWYARDDRGLVAVSDGITAEVPALLGCEMPRALAGQRGPVTPEQLAAFDPEIALVDTPAMADAIRTDAAWSMTAAVRHGRILVAPVGPFGWIDGPPSVQRLLGVTWLLSRLRPETHPRAAMLADAAGLLALLFGITADDRLMAHLLAT